MATKNVFIPDFSLWSLLLSKVLKDLKDLMLLIYTYLFYCAATRNRALLSNNRQNEVAETPGLYSRRHKKETRVDLFFDVVPPGIEHCIKQ
jgi:hypothetical protein